MMSARAVGHQALTGRPGDLSRFMFICECPEVEKLAIDSDARKPSALRRGPEDPPIARRSTLTRHILSIAAVGNDPEVGPPVVQFVEVPVIDFQAVTGNKTQQLSVQQDGATPFGAIGVATTPKTPTPLVRPGDVIGIEQRMRAYGSVTGAQGEQRDPIVPDRRDVRRWSAIARLAASGAVRMRLDVPRCAQDGRAACFAGKMNVHRGHLLGVTLPGRSNGHGSFVVPEVYPIPSSGGRR
jgi:hypothetical protein